MKNKLLKLLALAFTCLSISAVATACGGGDTPSSSSSEDLSSSVEDSSSSSSDSSSSSSEGLSSDVEDSSSSSSDSSSSEDNTPANMYPEESLQFQKIPGKEEYRVVGLGNVSDLEIVIPSTYRGLPVTEIGECAFRSPEGSTATANITSVVIPDGVTSIRYGAFSYCESLTSIEIPDSVTSIGDYAFYACDNLTSIELPDSVTSIGDSAFSGRDSLTIYCEAEGQPDGWDDGWNRYECPVVWDCKNNDVATDGYIYTTVDGIRYAVKDGLAIVVRQAKNITVANIASSITYKGASYTVASIGDSAFYGCDNLTSVVIPDSVTSIGNFAFSDCYNLQYTIKDNLKYLGNATNPYLYFGDTTSSDITSANIDDNCKFIGSSAFSDCSSLTSVVIPNSVTSIGDSAFRYCESLTSIEIPNSVTSIGDWAFYNCNRLTSVVIPDSVTSIGDDAFDGCRSLTEVHYTGTIDDWAQISFSDETANPLYYADNFYINNELVTEVKLTTATKISAYAFYGFDSLTSIEIPNSVESIGGGAFSDCYNLQYTIQDNLKYLGNATNPYLYLAGTTSSDITSANIDDNCKFIGGYALSDCYGLTSIEIPDSVTSIGSYAFYYCESLTSIVIPDSVTSIGDYAFYNCSSLTIYCEAEGQPDGWDDGWNSYECPVVWGYKGE